MRGIKKTLLEGMITTNGAVNSNPANQTINGALNTGALSVTGTSNATATVEDIQVITNATGINASLTNYVNTGGTVRVGVDRSTGGFSGSAYAYFVSVASGRSIQNVVNGTAITSVSSTGLAVTGNITQISGLPALNFASDAAAAAGGVAVGGLYHNAGVVHVRLT